MENVYLAHMRQRLEVVRPDLVDHPLYNSLHGLREIKQFTQFHVFAVWDFMSLLKSLQHQLTCTTIPWMPVGTPNVRYLINEIVLGEESDVNAEGERTSHFELYIRAMQEMGADTEPIEQLIAYLQQGVAVRQAMEQLQLPRAVQDFVGFTFDVVEKAPIHVQAAVFTFGREDLIPYMFMGLVSDLSTQYPNELDTFRYYLERHIEVDGDHHSKLAMQMVSELCGDDQLKWEQATEAAVESLTVRKRLWDALLAKVKS
jgi:hypothetical protein